MSQFQNCTEVTPECPVSATTYGYVPNLAGNVIFCIVFGICTIAQTYFSVRGKMWTWMLGLSVGCFMEFLGYIGRLLLHENVWNSGAFSLQVIVLIFAPSFIGGSIDLTLKYLVIHFGPQFSLFKPKWYTWIFIGFDIFCLLLQVAGGVIATGADDSDTATTGNDIVLVGIILQVVQLVVFGVCSGLFAWRIFSHAGSTGERVAKTPAKLKFFISMVGVAFVLILIRCCYRIAEMAGGWGSGLQRDEPTFLILDGAAVAGACVALTVAHPTFCFPIMGRAERKARAQQQDEEMRTVSK